MSTLVFNTLKPRSGDTVTFADCNVSIGGTATYEDVTNVDSVGIITAKSGIELGASGVGGTITAGGDATLPGGLDVTGIVTATGGLDVTGIVTAIGGMEIGSSGVGGTITSAGDATLPGGVNALGVVTATSFSGDGSNLSGVESGVVNFVASGTIANGATVIIKDDGTVGIVTQTGDPASVGSAAVFESGTVNYINSAYDETNDKVVIAYADSSNSGHATAVVGTVSGTDITFGTPVVFNAVNTGVDSVAYGNGKVVISYIDGNNSYYGTAIVGTVSGTSISFGTAVEYESAQTSYVSSTYDGGNGKFVIAYRDPGNSNYGTAIVGDVSGTSISFGSAAVFASATTGYITIAPWGGSGKVLIAYQDGGNSDKGTAIVGTVSGTSITFGSEVVFNDAQTTHVYCCNDFHTASTRSVIVYQDNGNSSYGTAIVATRSGDTISFGTPVVFNAATTTLYSEPVYNSTDYTVVIAYKGNPTGSDEGTAISGTISGTDITFGTAVELGDNIYDLTCAYDPDANKVVISYKDNDNSSYGTSVVYSESTLVTNLTAENYIGIAGEAIANTSTGKINIIGGINSGQSGLTTNKKYYVGQTGILTTTADTPSVVAGTSISDTKILVWKS